MLINYKTADGQTIELDVSDEIGTFYLSSLEAEKKNDRRNTRLDRHTSLESFSYEERKFFDDGTNILASIIEDETIRRLLSQLSERQQYLIVKCILEGWSYTDLAALEVKDESAIRHAVDRAKKKLRKIIS